MGCAVSKAAWWFTYLVFPGQWSFSSPTRVHPEIHGLSQRVTVLLHRWVTGEALPSALEGEVPRGARPQGTRCRHRRGAGSTPGWRGVAPPSGRWQPHVGISRTAAPHLPAGNSNTSPRRELKDSHLIFLFNFFFFCAIIFPHLSVKVWFYLGILAQLALFY